MSGIRGRAAFSAGPAPRRRASRIGLCAASKAVRSFARNWILDLKGRGIRVNTLSPGATRRPGLVALAGPDAAQQQGLLDHLASKVPMGRVGEPDEIAKAAVFLASDDASFIDGVEVFVDGGQAQV